MSLVVFLNILAKIDVLKSYKIFILETGYVGTQFLLHRVNMAEVVVQYCCNPLKELFSKVVYMNPMAKSH